MAYMRSFDAARATDLQDRGVPVDLACKASRLHVWHTYPNGIGRVAWVDTQKHEKITDLEWIEYIPQLGIPSVTECAACCGIPEDNCVFHGIL
jgi:hypothetical protein